MTDGDALYRAIIARPEDDTPRLVYADWLEEHGREEEAEFIRLDCWLEASSPGEPGYTESEIRREELRLWLCTHCPGPRLRFAGGLGLGKSGEKSNEWWSWTDRGFPRFLLWGLSAGRMERLGLKGIRQLATALEKSFEKLPTRWLSIRFIAHEELAEFLKQAVVAALDHLTINLEDQLGDDAARVVADCRQLRNLRGASLSFPVGERGANALGRCEYFGGLEWLAIDTAELTPQAIRTLGNSEWFTNLRTLILQDGLRADAFEELCRLPPCPNLHTLDLSNNSFTVTSWQQFARSNTFPKLTRLNIGGTDMSRGQMGALATASELRLATLDLHSCAIGIDGVRALVDSTWAGSLRNLNLANNLLSPTAVAKLVRCRSFPELKCLSLSGNPIGVSDLKALAGSQYFRNLVVLLLGNCSNSAKTRDLSLYYEFLDELDLPHLRYLDLSDMPIGPRAARLLEGEKFSDLTRLGLANCKLTDAAIADLFNSQSLQKLIELRLEMNSLKTGVAPLTDRRVMPRLSSCNLEGNPIDAELCHKLMRRPGIIVPGQSAS